MHAAHLKSRRFGVNCRTQHVISAELHDCVSSVLQSQESRVNAAVLSIRTMTAKLA